MFSFSENLTTAAKSLKLNQKQNFGCYCLLISLSMISLCLYTTQVSAGEVVNNIPVNDRLNQFNVSPHQLVFLAYRGYFVNQGIPSYAAFIDAYLWGKITSQDLVNIAIRTNRLPANYQTDSSYLSSVDYFLRDLSRAC